MRYPGDVLAVAEVDLDLHPGEVTAVMGRNGCGKSSLLWALQGSGILTSGTVRATRPAAERDAARHPRPSSRAASVPETVVRWSDWYPRRPPTCSTSTPSAPSATRPTARAACRAAPARASSRRWLPASPRSSTRATCPRARAGPRARRAADRRPPGAAARRAHPRPRPHRQGRPEPGAARPRGARPLGRGVDARRGVRRRGGRPGGRHGGGEVVADGPTTEVVVSSPASPPRCPR